MSTPNHFCPSCKRYGEKGLTDYEYWKKYGKLPCTGIPYETGEFPNNCMPHCWTDEIKKEEICPCCGK